MFETQTTDTTRKKVMGRPPKFGLESRTARVPVSMSDDDILRAWRAKKMLKIWKQEATMHTGPQWALVKELLASLDL